jgi:cyclopropane fatty-acyl-phospholipid synthase-like methyltransferase
MVLKGNRFRGCNPYLPRRIHWLGKPKRLQYGCGGISPDRPTWGYVRLMALPNAKSKIIEHYDVVSPYYYKLWGEHLHHGYWIRGDESKELAQQQLIEHLARLARIPQGAAVLDVGCGFGASSVYLCKQFGATSTGITISQVQVEMANAAAARDRVNASFCLMDAEAMTFDKLFDVLWSVESISHYHDREKFFDSAAKLLKPGGVFALTDWFKKPELSPVEVRKYISPIEQGMFVRLEEISHYEEFLRSNGMEILRREELTKHCARTWDLCLEIIGDAGFWALAAKQGRNFVRFLNAFRAMRAGFSSGSFVYGLLVARKLDPPTQVEPVTLPFRSGHADCPAD